MDEHIQQLVTCPIMEIYIALLPEYENGMLVFEKKD
jgi:hypothetical protein